MLTFDSDACIRSLVQRLIQVMDSLMSEFYRDATAGMSAEAKQDTELIKAKYDEAKEIIEAKCKFYVQAILESFGTGSLADTRPDESYWKEYTESPDFNKARARTYPAIVGRAKDKGDDGYYDVWGSKRHKKTNRAAGTNLEGLHIRDYYTGEYHQVRPIKPTYSIQNAEAWIIRDTETKVERRIKMEVEKFLAEEGSKFFVYSG